MASRENDRWIVLYDSDCGFCKWMLSGFLRWDRKGVITPRALQRPEAAELLADLTAEQRMASWHLVTPDGRRLSGGAAVPVLLRQLPGGTLPAAAVGLIPGPTDRVYTWVAANRSQLSKFVPSAAKRHASEIVRRREAQQAAATP
jgi:predicted DCC family thiol-disulfide oxidoreductase YuxK